MYSDFILNLIKEKDDFMEAERVKREAEKVNDLFNFDLSGFTPGQKKQISDMIVENNKKLIELVRSIDESNKPSVKKALTQYIDAHQDICKISINDCPSIKDRQKFLNILNNAQAMAFEAGAKYMKNYPDAII